MAITISGDTPNFSAATITALTSTTGTVTTLTSTTISDGTTSTSMTNAVSGSAKSWANFSASGGVVTIRASYNVSSISRASAGTFTCTFTNALTDANYAVCGTAKVQDNSTTSSASNTNSIYPYGYTSSAFSFVTANSGTAGSDGVINNLAVFR
jgi:hypothetical protein